MILETWIRLSGGLWRYRERFSSTRSGCVRKFRAFVYGHYLESLGSYIAVGAHFASEPQFPHKPLGVFVAPGSEIGSGVTIYQQVTIGENNTPGSKGRGSPVIGNNVYIGAGAKIIGNVVIGDGARIGAGAVVVKDVPVGGLAVSPAAIVRLPST